MEYHHHIVFFILVVSGIVWSRSMFGKSRRNILIGKDVDLSDNKIGAMENDGACALDIENDDATSSGDYAHFVTSGFYCHQHEVIE